MGSYHVTELVNRLAMRHGTWLVIKLNRHEGLFSDDAAENEQMARAFMLRWAADVRELEGYCRALDAKQPESTTRNCIVEGANETEAA